MKYHSKRDEGFTLVELVVVMVIVSVLALGLLEAYKQYSKYERIKETKNNILLIEEALKIYVQQRGRLPCAAPRTAAPDTANYAREVDCALAAPAGVTVVVSGPQNIYIGSVPTRSLNLPDAVGIDGWKRRYTYAVSSSLATTPANFNLGGGAIDVVDSGGVSVANPPGTVAYIVISHGEDGAGAFNHDGMAGNACDGATTDGENCNNDGTFRYTLSYSEASGATHFDDYVKHQFKEFILTSAISRYFVDKMNCDTSQVGDARRSTGSAVGENPYGERCSTLAATGVDLDIITGFGGVPNPRNGRRIYTRTITAESRGNLYIKAAIPIRILLENSSSRWENAIMAAIYVNGTEVMRGDLFNPFGNVSIPSVTSVGGTGILIGEFQNITPGTDYNIEIYTYMLHDPSGGVVPVPNQTAWIGSIKLDDHSVEGIVEILETGV